MKKIDGIIIDGQVYEVVPSGSYHCSDCDLYERCKERPLEHNALCMSFVKDRRIIFKISTELTDKIND